MFRIKTDLLQIVILLSFTALLYTFVWNLSEYQKNPEFYDMLCTYSVQVTEYYENSQSVSFTNGFSTAHSAEDAFYSFVKTYENTNLDSVQICINRDCSSYETIKDTTIGFCDACFPAGRGQ